MSANKLGAISKNSSSAGSSDKLPLELIYRDERGMFVNEQVTEVKVSSDVVEANSDQVIAPVMPPSPTQMTSPRKMRFAKSSSSSNMSVKMKASSSSLLSIKSDKSNDGQQEDTTDASPVESARPELQSNSSTSRIRQTVPLKNEQTQLDYQSFSSLPPSGSFESLSKKSIEQTEARLPPLPTKRNSSVDTSRRPSKTRVSVTEKKERSRSKDSLKIKPNQLDQPKVEVSDVSTKKKKKIEKLKQSLDILTFGNANGDTSDSLERSVSRGRRTKRDKDSKHHKKKQQADAEVNIEQRLKQISFQKPKPVQSVESTIEPASAIKPGSEIDSIEIIIHQADALTAAVNLRHPMVQIHFIDITSGEYLKKSSPNKAVTFPTEPLDLDFILPTVTKPYFLLENHTKTPIWEEKIVLNEYYHHILSQNVIVFFEIIDFLTSSKQIIKNKNSWQRTAWAFLKMIDINGKPTTEKKVRLQLYKYPPHLYFNSNIRSPYVYACWKEQWFKYPSTLYVTITGSKSIRARPKRETIPLQTEKKLKRYGTESVLKSIYDLNATQKPQWRRKKDEICKLPNKLLYKITAGNKGSLSCAFSNSGMLLAVASIGINSYPIKIYHFQTGERLATFDGHLDLVYSLAWSNNDTELISASSDGSIRVWGFMANGSIQQVAIFLHPSYVYCAVFHPIENSPNIIASACFDGSIRLWKHYSNVKSTSNKPFLKLDGHTSNVNVVCFGREGQKLYSGDGAGIVKIWIMSNNPEHQFYYECIKNIDTLAGNPIQCLKIHNSNRKLLVQTSKPTLHMLDTRIHRFLTHFVPAEPDRTLSPRPVDNSTTNSIMFYKSAFSACGEYVFVGTKVGTVHIWRSESGHYVGEYKHSLKGWINTNSPILDISFHPHDHCIAFSVWGSRESVLVYTWSESEMELKADRIETKQTKNLDVDKVVAKSIADLRALALAE